MVMPAISVLGKARHSSASLTCLGCSRIMKPLLSIFSLYTIITIGTISESIMMTLALVRSGFVLFCLSPDPLIFDRQFSKQAILIFQTLSKYHLY